MNNLTDSKVIPQGYLRLFTYADLKNPLLEKYKFDPVDFMEGATYAFERVHKAIGSVELVNFASGVVKENAQNDMLKATLSPQIYKATIEASKAMHDKIYLRKIDFKLHESHMVSIVTDVIEAKEMNKEGENTDSKHENTEQQRATFDDVKIKEIPKAEHTEFNGGKSSSNGDTFMDKNEQEVVEKVVRETQKLADARLGNPMEFHKEKKDPLTERLDSIVGDDIAVEKTKFPKEKIRNKSNILDDDFEGGNCDKLKYPIGSVIATATVYICGEETIEYVLPSMGPTGESVNKEQTTSVRFSWTFRGCISDHSELDWKIIALDGFGDTSL